VLGEGTVVLVAYLDCIFSFLLIFVVLKILVACRTMHLGSWLTFHWMLRVGLGLLHGWWYNFDP